MTSFTQIILVPSLVLVLLAEVSRLISMRSYVKIVAADTSYSLTRASLDRRYTLEGKEAGSALSIEAL